MLARHFKLLETQLKTLVLNHSLFNSSGFKADGVATIFLVHRENAKTLQEHHLSKNS